MKQFLLMCDDACVGALKQVVPALQFIEVTGMNISGNHNYMLLTTPIVPPVEEIDEPSKE